MYVPVCLYICKYYGLNASVPLKCIHTEALPPSVVVLEDRAFGR